MSPVFTHLTPADYVTTRWSGGSTTQLAIEPRSAVYADRDFLWRISSATVELEESDFTPLPDYRRFISTARGDMILSHNGGEPVTLHPLDVHAFEGGDDTRSRGRCTDFNLMLRRGKADGDLRSLRLTAEPRRFAADARAEVLLVYCAQGSCTAACGAERCALRAGESVSVRNAQGLSLLLEAEDSAALMLAQMWRI